ncbi:Uma2 family endonuclease [Kitasatospora purpeofusca]|uniref:Uma2 family endonuclease n=1 Tax=Kitasatospora purpeofusca TaxID=67352 RepID=UPI0022557DD8|nr:Uma2 family endonuclease [Kitasatospora purpeofusca]MCX4687839.1 Uma2 family endonuclease [Kitasatospora purpeofusca]
MSFYEQHRDFIEELERIAPEGVRIEWSGDTLTMQASPSNIHQLNIAQVRRQFERHAPDGYLPSERSEIVSPDVSKGREPDLTYLPVEVLSEPGNRAPAAEALIAVEIVSPSNPGNDWMDKLHDYAVMRIPLYLIVDPRERTVTLFSEPDHDRYHTRTDRKFGDGIGIPEPFGFTLDLAVLVPYRD